ncbi:13585_t:CDS:10 [Entrophospora sp. SA101]|nr:13585_t:CDS:10 [Entrophospora sp. SA101]
MSSIPTPGTKRLQPSYSDSEEDVIVSNDKHHQKFRKTEQDESVADSRFQTLNLFSKLLSSFQEKEESSTSDTEINENPESPPCKLDTFLIMDIQNLALACIADGICPRWMFIKNKELISKVVILMVPGLTPQFFGMDHETARSVNGPIDLKELCQNDLLGDIESINKINDVFPALSDIFSHACVTRAPDLEYLINWITLLIKIILVDTVEKLRKCLLTLEQMINNGYPIPSCYNDDNGVSPSEGWFEVKFAESFKLNEIVLFKEKNGETVEPKLIAMDCEMVTTTTGQALARISIVDEESKVIYDELVMPSSPVTDYLTAYSGITEELLTGVTTTLSDVQQKLLEIIGNNSILIGHSLECDLKVLKFAHPYIIDTSVLYSNGVGYPKPKLKHLTQKWLNRTIQEIAGDIVGHDPIEDASACMGLVKLKLEKGMEFDKITEPIFRRLARLNKRSVFIDDKASQSFGTDAQNIVICSTDEEVEVGLVSTIDDSDFVWARLLDFDVFSQSNNEELIKKVSAMNDRIRRIYHQLPSGTAFFVASGSGDKTDLYNMTQKKKSNPIDWSSEDQQNLENAVNKARIGLGFFRLKT